MCIALLLANYPIVHVQIVGKVTSVSTLYMYGAPAPYEFEDFAYRPRKVLHNVLKAPEHLQYQLAFLSSVNLN